MHTDFFSFIQYYDTRFIDDREFIYRGKRV